LKPRLGSADQARVRPVHRVPYLAEVTVGVILVAVALLADLRAAIGFSFFTVLLYTQSRTSLHTP